MLGGQPSLGRQFIRVRYPYSGRSSVCKETVVHPKRFHMDG